MHPSLALFTRAALVCGLLLWLALASAHTCRPGAWPRRRSTLLAPQALPLWSTVLPPI